VNATDDTMTTSEPTGCTAFEGSHRIASGGLPDVARAVKAVIDRGENGPVLVFDDRTSQPIELDLRGSLEDVLRKIALSE
jgi:hypothetical protein